MLGRSISFALVLCLAGALRSEESKSADVVAGALALIEARRLPEAREPLETLLRDQPDNLEAALLLARVYCGMGRLDDGISLLDPVVEKHGSDPRAVGMLGGQCLLRAGELGAGFRALRLSRRGRDLLERAVRLAPDDISYREGLVDFYRQAPGLAGGSLEKAREHAAAIARMDPVRGAVWQAAVLMQEKKHAEALAACDAALAARPDDYVALYTFGRISAESGLRIVDGERALRRCLEKISAASEPSHAAVWHRLGLIAERRGDRDGARAAYREALRLEPSFTRPQEALKRLDEAG